MMQPFIRLRVLTQFDDSYKTHVAYCLETGSVVTADAPETLEREMTELLEDEISFALETRNLQNLFSSPAPFDKWIKWQEIAEKQEPEPISLVIDLAKPVRKGFRDISNEVTFAKAQI